MFYVYVLRSETSHGRYVGSCADLRGRLARHNAGIVNATKAGVPWILIHSEPFSTRSEAVRRELHLKTGGGRDEVNCVTTAPHLLTNRMIRLCAIVIVSATFAAAVRAQDAATP